MRTRLSGFPAGVIGFEAVGQIEATDCRDVLEGASSGGVREDRKLGVDRVTRHKRIALDADG